MKIEVRLLMQEGGYWTEIRKVSIAKLNSMMEYSNTSVKAIWFKTGGIYDKLLNNHVYKRMSSNWRVYPKRYQSRTWRSHG